MKRLISSLFLSSLFLAGCEKCGNNRLQGQETCEDGNNQDGDGCDSNCTFTACGNGVTTAPEQCDDGNTTNNDGCNDQCQREGCGNGVTDAATEVCDDGNFVDGDGCSADCQSLELCGDGVVDTLRGEQCDDANSLSGDGCSQNCFTEPSPTCGNGSLEANSSEQCDDNNNIDLDGCSAACLIEAPASCGDGVVDYLVGEECDDLNNTSGDGCSAACLIEVVASCGDGTVNLALDEECDDGNRLAGDGCSSACQFEPIGASCGNGGALDPLEVCDDGNLLNGDACNPTCNLTNTTSVFVGTQGVSGNVDGVGIAAQIGSRGVLSVDNDFLYLADGINHTIRRIDVNTADVQTIAGNGIAGFADDPIGINAQFAGVEALTTDGFTLWVADSGGANFGARIREIDLTDPNFAVTTVAGGPQNIHQDGIGAAAGFSDIRGTIYFNGLIYLADANAATIRQFNPITQEVLTLAGQAGVTGFLDGVGNQALFTSPRYLASDGSGMIYVADTNGNSMRAFNTITNEVTTFAGNGVQGYVDGIGTQAQIHRPRGLTSDGSSIYWAEFNQHTIRQGVLATQEVSTVVGTSCFPAFCPGFLDGTGAGLANTLFDLPFSVAFHFPSNSLFVVDGGNAVIRRIQ